MSTLDIERCAEHKLYVEVSLKRQRRNEVGGTQNKGTAKLKDEEIAEMKTFSQNMDSIQQAA